MPQRPLQIINWITAILLLGTLPLFLLSVSNTLALKSRSQAYLSYAQAWVDSHPRSLSQVTPPSSPWGGNYRVCAKLPGYEAPALLISGFPPGQPTDFSDSERERLQNEWQAKPIPKAKLIFHFNGLPAVVLAP